MARVLHLLEKHPDYQTRSGVGQLTRQPSTSQIRTIGRGGDFPTALAALFHFRSHAADFDIIHAWGEPALSIAALSGGGRPIVYSPACFPSQRDIRWLRAILAARDINIACSTDTIRRRFVERGVPIARCHLVRPGVDFSKINRRRNQALRDELGFGPEDFVLLAVGESTRGANHHATILAAAVLHAFDSKYKLLLWGSGPLAESDAVYATKMLPGEFLSIASKRLGSEVAFEQLLAAADGVLITADGPIPTLPIAVCMAAALPIVAVVSPTVAELLEDRHNCLMVGRSTSRMIARRVLDMREDPQLQWSISDAARTDAYEFFTMTRFIDQFRAVYQQVSAGEAVQVPQPPPGAGLRFSGRA